MSGTDCPFHRLKLFECKHGILLVPHERVLPPDAATRHSPVTIMRGYLDCAAELPATLCSRVRADIDANAYAFLANAEARKLGIKRAS